MLKMGYVRPGQKELGKEILSLYPFLAKLVKYSVVIRVLGKEITIYIYRYIDIYMCV